MVYFFKQLIDKNIHLLSYLYKSNLNVPDITFQPLYIWVKYLVTNIPIPTFFPNALQYNIMMAVLLIGSSWLTRGPWLPTSGTVYRWSAWCDTCLYMYIYTLVCTCSVSQLLAMYLFNATLSHENFAQKLTETSLYLLWKVKGD